MATTIELSGGHQFVNTYDFVTIIGTDGADSLTLGPKVYGATLYNVETVAGSSSAGDTVILGSSTGFLTISGIETIVGSGGHDAVALTGSTPLLTVQGVESLTDLSGLSQTVRLGGSYNNLTVNGIETVQGGNGDDTIVLGDGQAALTIVGPYSGANVEAVAGNASFNVLTLLGAADVTLSSIESVVGDGGYQSITLTGSVNAITVNGIDHITGTGATAVTLTGSIATLTIAGVQSVTDVSGTAQAVQLSNNSLNFVTLDGIETIQGGTGYDAVTITGGASIGVLTVTGIESLTDLSGNVQTVTVTGHSAAVLTLNGIETLHSDTYGNDTITLGDGQKTLTYSSSSGSDTIIGNADFNTLVLQGASSDVTLSSIESVTSASGYHTIRLDGNGGTLFASGDGIAEIHGGAGVDTVIITGSISHLTIGGVETLTDWSGTNQTVTLSGSSTGILTISGIETVHGSSGHDAVTLNGQDNLTFVTHSGGNDTITGNAGFNTLTLEGHLSSITVSSIESINGPNGMLAVILADGGNTVAVSGIETIIGGSGYDAVTLAPAAWPIPQVSGVESLTSDGSGSASITGFAPSMTVQGFTYLAGDSMYQEVHLTGISAAILTINGIDQVFGTGGDDTITVSGGTTAVTGGAGADTITLFDNASSHQAVAFAAATDGSAAGVNSGFDVIENFDVSQDSIVFRSGPLLSEIKKGESGNGFISRTGGTVDASKDEIVQLTTTVNGSLADSGYQSFRTALGTLSNDSASSLIVIANNGTDTGIYLVKSDGSGGVGAGEVSLLGLVKDRTGLGFGNITTYAS